MADQDLVRAVQEVKRASNQAVVSEACSQALKAGTDAALRVALIKTHDVANTWVAKDIADRALGLK